MDDRRCPLCGGDNACGAAQGTGSCWCFSVRIPDEVLERVPAELRGTACICESCATGRSRPCGQRPHSEFGFGRGPR